MDEYESLKPTKAHDVDSSHLHSIAPLPAHGSLLPRLFRTARQALAMPTASYSASHTNITCRNSKGEQPP